jgi:hypothetical protein
MTGETKRWWQLGIGMAVIAAAGTAIGKDVVLKGSAGKSFAAPETGFVASTVPPGVLTAAKPDPDPDENQPDRNAWRLLIDISKKATTQRKVGPSHVTSNDALWETWADDGLTFPDKPDPAHPPGWPATAESAPAKRLVVPAQNTLRRLMLEKKPFKPELFNRPLEAPVPERSLTAPKGKPSEELSLIAGGGEEVRRNKPAFDFIVNDKLYYKQGLAAAFAAGKTIVFPADAIEVKARWVPITEAKKSDYHWNYDSNGALYGLVALHIMTKHLPNWTWATFEWTGNAGRCDYIGCHDAFGVTPHDVEPKKPLGGAYPPGTLTADLLAMFKAAGLGDEWKNYRLKGAQDLFTDTTGRPTLLGNSVTEEGFVSSSSCITCHGQASVDKDGDFNPSVGFTSTGASTNGPLLPSMFWTSTTPPKLKYLPIDFIWAVLHAHAAP